MYSLHATTGARTTIGSAVRLELGTGKVAFDFNPTVDCIRVTVGNQANYRLPPRWHHCRHRYSGPGLTQRDVATF